MNNTSLKSLFLLLTLNFVLSSLGSVIFKNHMGQNIDATSSSLNPSLASFQEGNLKQPNRAKRYTAAILQGLDDRLYGVEDQMNKSHSTIEHLRGFLSAIGFVLNSGDSQNVNPCKRNKEGQSSSDNDDNDWYLIGSSTCVKIINGEYTYDQATGICRNELQIGQDITYPEVLLLDSKDKQDSILDLVRTHQPSVAGVWVDIISNGASKFGNFTPVGSREGCVELRNGGQGVQEATGRVPWLKVQCTRTNSIICEKTLPIPYAEIVRKYSDRVEVEKRLDLSAHLERVELKKRVDSLDSWQEMRQEEVIRDSEKSKLMGDEIENLKKANVARIKYQEGLQTQLDDLKRKNAGLEIWKQRLLEKVQVLENESISGKREVTSLRRKIQELLSWKSMQIGSGSQANSASSAQPFQNSYQSFVVSRN